MPSKEESLKLTLVGTLSAKPESWGSPDSPCHWLYLKVHNRGSSNAKRVQIEANVTKGDKTQTLHLTWDEYAPHESKPRNTRDLLENNVQICRLGVLKKNDKIFNIDDSYEYWNKKWDDAFCAMLQKGEWLRVELQARAETGEKSNILNLEIKWDGEWRDYSDELGEHLVIEDKFQSTGAIAEVKELDYSSVPSLKLRYRRSFRRWFVVTSAIFSILAVVGVMIYADHNRLWTSKDFIIVSEAGCITALAYTMENESDVDASVRATALQKNLEAASASKDNRKIKISNTNVDKLKETCREICALWENAESDRFERQKLFSQLSMCLETVMARISENNASSMPPRAEASNLVSIPMDKGGFPQRNGAVDATAICKRTIDGFEVNITNRSIDSSAHIGCCIDLPPTYIQEWTFAKVQIHTDNNESALDIKLEDESGKRQAYLHRGPWMAGSFDEVKGGLAELRHNAPYRLCAFGVGNNMQSPQNRITVSDLRVAK